jgi:hypothetical protein
MAFRSNSILIWSDIDRYLYIADSTRPPMERGGRGTFVELGYLVCLSIFLELVSDSIKLYVVLYMVNYLVLTINISSSLQ